MECSSSRPLKTVVAVASTPRGLYTCCFSTYTEIHIPNDNVIKYVSFSKGEYESVANHMKARGEHIEPPSMQPQHKVQSKCGICDDMWMYIWVFALIVYACTIWYIYYYDVAYTLPLDMCYYAEGKRLNTLTPDRTPQNHFIIPGDVCHRLSP